MNDRAPDASIVKYQKFVIGILGLVMLTSGGLMYALVPTGSVVISAVLIRAGMLLCVVWLAFDQLQQLSRYFSTIVLMVGLGVLVLMAAKPNFSKIVLLMCVALGVLSLAAKFLRANR